MPSPLPPLVEPAANSTRDEVARYSRHLIIPDLGVDGQKRLKNARVLVIGAGGLGSPTLMYLAAAGVGTIGIVEFDVVDESNLQRQIIHGESDIGRSKAQSAPRLDPRDQPFVDVRLHEFRLEPDNAVELFEQYDLIVDGTDNFATRYLVNDAAVLAGKPYVWGSIYRFEGQVSVFWEDAPADGRLTRPELPRPVSRAAAAGHGAVLRRGRRARRPVRLDRFGDGHRGDQADHRHRRAAAGPADGLRRTGHDLPDHQDPQGSGGAEDHRADRLRAVLRCGLEAAADAAHDSTVTPRELRDLLDSGSKIALIDVREPGGVGDQPHRGRPADSQVGIESGDGLAKIPHDRIAVLYCKTGVRSAEALAALKKAGFSDALHLQGGIVAWARQLEPDMVMY